MGTPTIDFTELNAFLIKDTRLVELSPTKLVRNGYGLQLVPSRDGKILDCTFVEEDTLPVLDLQKAGIETDRRADTIIAAVKDLLEGRRFALWPAFDIAQTLSQIENMLVVVHMKALLRDYERTDIFRNTSNEPDAETVGRGIINDLPAVSFWVVPEDDKPICGLDLSQRIEGHEWTTVIGFFLPKNLRLSPSQALTLKKAVAFYKIEYEMLNAKRQLTEKSSALFFRLLRRKRVWEKRIAGLETELSKAYDEYVAVLKAA